MDCIEDMWMKANELSPYEMQNEYIVFSRYISSIGLNKGVKLCFLKHLESLAY